MDSKQEAQNIHSALVQVETEETGLSAEEQRGHVNKMDELMDFLPVIPLETYQEADSEAETELNKFGVMSQKKLDDAEYKTLACFSTREPTVHNEGINEQPAVGVELVITEKQSQYKEPDSCLGDVVAESNELVQDYVTQDSDLGHDAPQEMNKLFVTDVSAEQSAEPDREISPTLDVAQDLCGAVKDQVEDPEKATHAMEEQEVEHVTKTFEQVDELMDFIPTIPLQKDQEAEYKPAAGLDTFGVLQQPKALGVELDAVIEVTDDVNSFVSETEQGSNTTSDLIEDNVVETKPVADMVSSDLQKSPDAEPRTSMVTHLTLRIEDKSDDIIYVKEWRVSPTEENEPSSRE